MITYPIVIILLVCAVIALAVGGMLALSNRRKHVNVWAGIMVGSAGLWSLLMLLFLLQDDPDLAAWYARFYYVAALMMAGSLYNFSQFYPRLQPARSVERTIFWALFGLAVLMSLVPGGVTDHATMDGLYNEMILSPLGYALFICVFVSLVATGFIRLISGYVATRKTQTRIRSHQVLMIIYSLGGVVIAGLYFDIVLPLMGNYRDIWIGPPFTLFVTLYLLYVLTTRGLFDVRAALARSVARIATMSAVLVVYIAVIFGAGDLLFQSSQVSSAELVFYTVTMLLVAMSVGAVRQWFDKLTYRLFYHRDYNYNQVVRQFSKVTANEIELDQLVSKSLDILIDALAPAYVSMYVLSDDGKTYHYSQQLRGRRSPHWYRQQLTLVRDIMHELPHVTTVSRMLDTETRRIVEDSGADVVVQLTAQDELVGFFFLGERQNGRPYSEQDEQLLATVADSLAIAVQNGLRFEEIKLFNKRLRREINTATKELRQSNAQLHRIDEVKDEFLSIASHQLRTPLTSVKGYLSLVLDGDAGPVNAQQKQLLEEAFTSSQRMVNLIEDFLNISRLQTGRFVVTRTPHNIVTMIDEEIELLRATAAKRRMKLSVHKEGDLPTTMQIDEGKLRQVVMNFIDNALYYSQPDSTIDIYMTANKKKFEFTVKDTGIGVPKEAQKHLFGKFYRASNARSRRPDGTGIGLYLAKKVVTEHDGEIIFKSVENKGSTFGFWLPIK